jgi:hypothetical protein
MIANRIDAMEPPRRDELRAEPDTIRRAISKNATKLSSN